jgi:hypothetical protein
MPNPSSWIISRPTFEFDIVKDLISISCRQRIESRWSGLISGGGLDMILAEYRIFPVNKTTQTINIGLYTSPRTERPRSYPRKGAKPDCLALFDVFNRIFPNLLDTAINRFPQILAWMFSSVRSAGLSSYQIEWFRGIENTGYGLFRNVHPGFVLIL